MTTEEILERLLNILKRVQDGDLTIGFAAMEINNLYGQMIGECFNDPNS